MLGSRLRRLSERLLSDVAQIYRSAGIDFEAPWFPLFYLLKHKGAISVTDLAREVEITHSGASQMVTLLEKKGLVRCDADPSDKRIRIVSFTQKGEERLAQVQPVWKALSAATQGLLAEREHSAALLSAFDELEAGLDERGLHSRTMEDLEKRLLLERLELLPYDADHDSAFRDLVLGWLRENPVHHIEDTCFLNETEAMIQRNDLHVLLAGLEKRIVGTVVAQRCDASVTRIVLLAVLPAFRNMGLESQLMKQVLADLQLQGVTRVDHLLSSQNSDSIGIFQKEGFQLDGLNQNEGESLTLNLSKLLMN